MGVAEFIWVDWNRFKIERHALSIDEVEFAWRNESVLRERVHPVNGPYWETEGTCPSRRVIRIV